MRAFSALCFVNLQLLVISLQPVVAQQPLPFPQQSPLPNAVPPGQLSPQLFPKQPPLRQFSPQPPVPPPATEVTPSGVSDGTSPQFSRYILGIGDVLGVSVQRPPGSYILGPGDGISVVVQRFPDLSFQASINPEGNIVVPLLGTVKLQGLTLQQAQNKIRLGLNRFVADPLVTLSLTALRPELSFQAPIGPEGTILLPQVGTLSVQGLTLDEAQEKIRLALSRIFVKPNVAVSLVGQRPIQVSISGEVPRPGIYPVNPITPRVSDALLLAGGTMTRADLRQVQVRRKLIDGSVVSQNIDLYTPLLNGTGQGTFRLQDGDAIIVPRREIATDDNYDRNLVARSTLAVPQIRIRILNYPGGGLTTIPLPNGSNIIDALSGITLDTSNLHEIGLVRFDAERGRAVTQRIDASKALKGDLAQNVALQDNDVIVVNRNLIGKITNAISTITRPFFDIQSFIRFFQFLGGSNNY
ncbi:MAG: polysaccharide biosynthesis/export family protein [Rhizonema sp. PD38]|nr:polysaccharide biosynthesis/export family protein [Rhizonema sp. PD38]